MKKRIAIILIFALLLTSFCALTACRDAGNDTDDAKEKARFYTDDTLSPYVLTADQEQSVREQYLQINPTYIDDGATIENVKVRKCFGQVNEKIVLSFEWIVSEDFVIFRISVPSWPVMISDVPIDLIQNLALLYNGTVYDLKDAFEQKVINHSELVTIAFASWGTEDIEQYIV